MKENRDQTYNVRMHVSASVSIVATFDSRGFVQLFKPTNGLPDPRGTLSSDITPEAISLANKEVDRILKDSTVSKKRGASTKYPPELGAEIGRYAVIHGTSAAARYYTRKLKGRISKSTVQSIKRSYEDKSKRQRSSLRELHMKPRGRPLLLGQKLDSLVQLYLGKVREGGVVNRRIAEAAARGITMKYEKEKLVEFGGHVKLGHTWAESLLARMKFVQRKASTAKSKQSTADFEQLKSEFLRNVPTIVFMEDIKPDLIFNWVQTGVKIVQYSSWTFEKKGSKRVEISGLEDKRQITAVLCGSLVGDFLPVQLVYKAKTDRCHPKFSFSAGWHITHAPNHWSTEQTMIQYISEISLPYINQVRVMLNDDNAPALLIIDTFKGQITESVNQMLEESNVNVCLLLANSTNRLQPMDISVIKTFKACWQRKFEEWYSEELANQLSEDEDIENIALETVDLSLARVKEVGAAWLVEASDQISDNPSFIVNGF